MLLINRKRKSIFAIITAMMILTACATAPKTETDRSVLKTEAESAIKVFKQTDVSMTKLFESAYGYAVFPSIGKGGVGIGGAFGRGVVYQADAPTGFCLLEQGTIGFQLGGQTYQQVIFFETESAYDEFIAGDFAFSAEASAVAATAGASVAAEYLDGVLVFTHVKGGLMYEASIGGQNFSFEAI